MNNNTQIAKVGITLPAMPTVPFELSVVSSQSNALPEVGVACRGLFFGLLPGSSLMLLSPSDKEKSEHQSLTAVSAYRRLLSWKYCVCSLAVFWLAVSVGVGFLRG